MIYLYRILKHIRERQNYQLKEIASILGITRHRLHTLENNYRNIPPELLIKWLNALDISNHSWYLQKQQRDAWYKQLEGCPLPDQLKSTIADIFTFRNEVPLEQLQKLTLPYLLRMPREAEVAKWWIESNDRK